MSGTIVVEAAGGSGAGESGDGEQAAASAEPSAAANPDTALPLAGGVPTLLMGLGLLVVALSLFRFAPRAVARVARPGGGWNR
jgi:hypothetical protein